MLGLGLATPAIAQTTSTGNPLPLANVGTPTELQSNTGQGVQAACGKLGAAGGTSLAGSTGDLFLRCRELVQTATNGANSLNLTDDELNAALQQVAGEEALTTTRFATESMGVQITNVVSRIGRVRRTTGIAVGALSPDSDAGTAVAASSGRWTPVRGGAAGDAATGIPGLSVFITGSGGFGEDDGTERENGFDFDGYGVTAGADYRLRENLVVGGAFGYGHLNADYDTTATVAGGDVDSDAFTFSAYGTYFVDNYYVDGIVSYGFSDYDLSRRIVYATENRTATADTDSNQFAASVGGGAEFGSGKLSYGPFARLGYLHLDVDGYTEAGAAELNLRVEDQDVDSLTSGLGGQLTLTDSYPFGVLTGQMSLEWIHEFLDESETVRAFYVADTVGTPSALTLITDKGDRDFFELSLSATAVLPKGWQAFGNYSTIIGHEDISSHLFSVGARIEF